jgi:hypothetical protein
MQSDNNRYGQRRDDLLNQNVKMKLQGLETYRTDRQIKTISNEFENQLTAASIFSSSLCLSLIFDNIWRSLNIPLKMCSLVQLFAEGCSHLLSQFCINDP